MRPRVEVLLLMRNEDELGRWRLLLELTIRFRVLGATSLAEADALLALHPEVYVAATNIPGPLGADALVGCFDRVLLFDVGSGCIPGRAHVVVLSGPELARIAIDALCTLAARKRGPKPLPKITEPQRLRQLVIERDGVPEEAAA